MVTGMAKSEGLEPAGELERSKGVCASTRFIDKGRSTLALVAALFQPIWQSAILGRAEFSLAITAFLLLVCWNQPAWRVVMLCAVVGGLVFT